MISNAQSGVAVGVAVSVEVAVGVCVTVGVAVSGGGVKVQVGRNANPPVRPVTREVRNFSTIPSRMAVSRMVGHQVERKGVMRLWR